MEATHVPYAILAERYTRYQRQYLLSWRGFHTLRDATWESKFDDGGERRFDKCLESDFAEDKELQLQQAECVSAYTFLCSVDERRPSVKTLKGRFTGLGSHQPKG
jgi:hypothetical protein